MFTAIVPGAPLAEAKKERCNTLSRASTAESLSAILQGSSSSTEDHFAAVLDSVKSSLVVAQPTAAIPIDEVAVVGQGCRPRTAPSSAPKAASIFGTVERPVCLRRLPSVQSSQKRMEELGKPRTTLFERASAARLEKRRQQEAPAVERINEGQVAAEESSQAVSALSLKMCNHSSGPCETPLAGQAAKKPRPAAVERMGSVKFARIHGLPSARSPVARKDEICEPQKDTVVAKSSVSKFARIRSLPSASSPRAPKEESSIERREAKVVEKNSVKLPTIHGSPPATPSSKVGRRAAKKDQSAARPNSATMWRQLSKFVRLPGLASARPRGDSRLTSCGR